MRKAWAAQAASLVRRTVRARGRSSVAALAGRAACRLVGRLSLALLAGRPRLALLAASPWAWRRPAGRACRPGTCLRLRLAGRRLLAAGRGLLARPPRCPAWTRRRRRPSCPSSLRAASWPRSATPSSTSMKRLRFLGLALACAASSSGLGIVRRMTSCWPIVQTFVVTQYTNRPAGKRKRKSTNMIGMARMIHFCVLVALGRHHELGRDHLRDDVEDQQDVGGVGLPEMRDPQEAAPG